MCCDTELLRSCWPNAGSVVKRGWITVVCPFETTASWLPARTTLPKWLACLFQVHPRVRWMGSQMLCEPSYDGRNMSCTRIASKGKSVSQEDKKNGSPKKSKVPKSVDKELEKRQMKGTEWVISQAWLQTPLADQGLSVDTVINKVDALSDYMFYLLISVMVQLCICHKWFCVLKDSVTINEAIRFCTQLF